MSETVIKIENIGKQYRLGQVGTGTISHDLNRWWYKIRGKEDPFLQIGDSNDPTKTGDSEYVWSLKDINFDVKKGEAVGIVGKNGAGKSTLLKILSQVTTPTTGSVKVKGRIASLLEVGTGFHQELTGRENIFLNGAILGMSKKEIKSKLEEIIAFSGVERYIDTPVKRYSSGQRVRLAFAVAAHLDPEILVIDEVLAVGDAEFQNKCIGKMQDVAESGRTILFVSHNMSAVRNLCTRVIVLSKGKVIFDGDADEGINVYQKANLIDSSLCSSVSFPETKEGKAQFTSVSLKTKEGNSVSEFEYLDNIYLEIEFIAKEKLADIFVAFILEDDSGNWIFISANDDQGNAEISKLDEGKYKCNVEIPSKILKTGKYYLTFSLRPKSGNPYDKKEYALTFNIIDTKTNRGMKGLYRSSTVVAPEITWRIK